MSGTLREVVWAIQSGRAALVGESAGYLVLLAADRAVGRPMAAHADSVRLEMDGTVLLEGRAVTEAEAEQSLRLLLGGLLREVRTRVPNLERVSERRESRGLATLILELEAALVPVNRRAAKRSLSRLARETQRAFEARSRDFAVGPATVQPEAPRAPAPAAPAVVTPVAPQSILERALAEASTSAIDVPVEIEELSESETPTLLWAETQIVPSLVPPPAREEPRVPAAPVSSLAPEPVVPAAHTSGAPLVPSELVEPRVVSRAQLEALVIASGSFVSPAPPARLDVVTPALDEGALRSDAAQLDAPHAVAAQLATAHSATAHSATAHSATAQLDAAHSDAPQLATSHSDGSQPGVLQTGAAQPAAADAFTPSGEWVEEEDLLTLLWQEQEVAPIAEAAPTKPREPLFPLSLDSEAQELEPGQGWVELEPEEPRRPTDVKELLARLERETNASSGELLDGLKRLARLELSPEAPRVEELRKASSS